MSSRLCVTMSNNANGVTVCCRFRPCNEIEKNNNSSECVQVAENVVNIKLPAEHKNLNLGDERTFAFDKVFASNTTQEDVYANTSRPLVQEVLHGYNWYAPTCVTFCRAVSLFIAPRPPRKPHCNSSFRSLMLFPPLTVIALFSSPARLLLPW